MRHREAHVGSTRTARSIVHRPRPSEKGLITHRARCRTTEARPTLHQGHTEDGAVPVSRRLEPDGCAGPCQRIVGVEHRPTEHKRRSDLVAGLPLAALE
eukprot:6771539-Heterocapsa_arctica.AAC.1